MLCGSQNCGCAITGTGSIAITGSGQSGDPYVISGSPTQNPTIQSYTNVSTSPSTSSWIKPANLKFIIVEVQAPGGGSAGCPSTGAGQVSVGAPGGGGGYGRKTILASALGSSETVTLGGIGAGGAVGVDGGAGGTTSFGLFVSATGGGGGAASTVVTGPTSGAVNGGSGGTCTGGDLNVQGGAGHLPFIEVARGRRPVGGSSFFGTTADDNTNQTGANGSTGRNYGGGASGSFNTQNQATARSGSPGGQCLVIVQEFYN